MARIANIMAKEWYGPLKELESRFNIKCYSKWDYGNRCVAIKTDRELNDEEAQEFATIFPNDFIVRFFALTAEELAKEEKVYVEYLNEEKVHAELLKSDKETVVPKVTKKHSLVKRILGMERLG